MMTTLADAWHTIAPPEGDRHGPLQPLLLALTVVTGLVDAFSYLVLGHVFVANMTGNVVFLAFALVGAKGFSIGASLAALSAFAVGAAGSGRIGHPPARPARPQPGRHHHPRVGPGRRGPGGRDGWPRSRARESSVMS